MVNFMGNIEKGKYNSLEKLNMLLKSAPRLAKDTATGLVGEITYQVKVRLDQGTVQLLSYMMHLPAVSGSTRDTKPASAVSLLTVCSSSLCSRLHPALWCIFIHQNSPCRPSEWAAALLYTLLYIAP